MDWKKFSSLKHQSLLPHHHYQMTVILLFVFFVFLFVPYYFAMEEFKLDMQEWQWYFFLPLMLFYSVYCLRERSKIQPEERVDPLKRPIAHWVLLGVTILAYQLQPQENQLEKLAALNFAFIIFSIFLADSYWDFRNFKKWYRK